MVYRYFFLNLLIQFYLNIMTNLHSSPVNFLLYDIMPCNMEIVS